MFVLMKRSTLHLNSEVKEQSSRIWERVSTCSWQREQFMAHLIFH